MSVVEHQIAFRGSVAFAEPTLDPATVAVVDAPLEIAAGWPSLRDQAVGVVELDRRPTSGTVAELAQSAIAMDARQIIGVGSGALIDAVKLVSLRVEAERGLALGLTFVPCGPEPYRAFARFAVVDDLERGRPTVLDDRFAAANVVIAPYLLEQLPASVAALYALDTAVHAFESILSTRATPLSVALASTALRTVRDESGSVTGLSRARVIVASLLATEAFCSTRLGLAHALASPLGTLVGITHDSINGVLGSFLAAFWGGDAEEMADVARALEVPAETASIREFFDRLRVEAALPPSLDGLGISWADVSAALPQAKKSSGVAVLPRQLAEPELEAFAHAAWNGYIDEEVFAC